MVDRFTASTFSPHLGDEFRIYPGPAPPVTIELVDCQEIGGSIGPGVSGRPGRLPFSLVFRGPRETVLPQRIYRIEHETLGAFELFLVPIGPDSEGMRYEAVFT